MRTLLEFLPLIRNLGAREALRFHSGYRTWKYSYRDLHSRISAFATYLNHKRISKGDRLLIWGENRLEWAAVFWACVARGVEVVPLDYRSSSRFVGRIEEQVQPRLLVLGEEVKPEELKTEQMSFREVAELPEADAENSNERAADISPDDIVQIVFTSGTTGDPKGVIHRHKNICANLNPIHREIEKYAWLARPFQPIRLLDLLPLSHLFGQSAGLYIPPLLGGAAVFTTVLNPGALMETIRRERVSVLVAVPRLLQSLRNELKRKSGRGIQPPQRRGLLGAAESWWRYRSVHKTLGWKFWAVVVGGAELDAELEAFWRHLGFVVVQGYGLTETSPVVALNHPFKARGGSIGQAIEGQQIKIAPDGEILVKGDSVVAEYLTGGKVSPAELEDGWLHTGDLGEIDEQGRLYYKGRLKEMIATAEGLNVYPSDIEHALNRLPQVQDSAVVGRHKNGRQEIHAVLLLRDSAARPEELVAKANRELEAHQRIQSWSVWPEEDFPRTASTMKLKRAEIERRVAEETDGRKPPDREAQPTGLLGALAELTGRPAGEIRQDQRLSEDLGLSSLERVELMARLEDEWAVGLDEAQLASLETVGDLQAVVEEARQAPPEKRESPPPVPPQKQRRIKVLGGEAAQAAEEREIAASLMPRLPRWNRSTPVRWARRILLDGVGLPMFRQMLVRFYVEGLENIENVSPPVIFAANHTSHFDVIALYAALPRRLRHRLAPAMSQDYFLAYWDWRRSPAQEILKIAGQYYLACFLVNAYPLPQKMSGTRRALRYTGELMDEGFCPVVFPEGRRSPDGKMHRFKSGIGLMALRLGVPVVPVYLEGLYEIYSVHHEWPEPGSIRVRFGQPLDLRRQHDYEAAAEAVERAVRRLRAVSEEPA